MHIAVSLVAWGSLRLASIISICTKDYTQNVKSCFCNAVGDICPEFCQFMSFEEFIDFLKQRGVMRKDIDLLKSK